MIELLKNLVAAVSFRPVDGPFRDALIARALADVADDRVELFSESNCDIKVTISQHTQLEGFIRVLVVSDLGEKTLECDLSGLNELEKADLRDQVLQQAPEHRPVQTNANSRVIVRNAPTGGMYTLQQSADKLGFSSDFVKSKIPCTDYSYDEIDGKKILREYYWAQPLIDRLQQVKSAGIKPDDLAYVAAECCYGDSTWAEELLSALRPKANVPGGNAAKKQSSRFRSRGGSGHHPDRKKQG